MTICTQHNTMPQHNTTQHNTTQPIEQNPTLSLIRTTPYSMAPSPQTMEIIMSSYSNERGGAGECPAG
jgi:hypothetical protein